LASSRSVAAAAPAHNSRRRKFPRRSFPRIRQSAALRRFGFYTGRIADAGVAVAANGCVPLRLALMIHPSAHSRHVGICNTNLVAHLSS
ncbi:MAG: hypothetical protein OXL41_08645, partial [Nitrospinae bacterium]|nr:hypothetical protein [Nitrospinota bacterium]